MPEDRFGDLGPDRPSSSAAERFEEEDRLRPEPDMPRRPQPPRPGSRYAWVVGILMLMGIAVLLLTTALPNSGEGLRGPRKGKILPAFAAPLATSRVDDDAQANVFQSRKAARTAKSRLSACEVRTPEVLNSCTLRAKASVLSFVVTEGADCEPQIDRVERMRREFPEVAFATVMSGEKRSEAEQIVKRRGWGMPVGVDRDGAVVNLYGVGVCPTTVFTYPGGAVRTVKLGNLTEDELRRQVRALVAPRR